MQTNKEKKATDQATIQEQIKGYISWCELHGYKSTSAETLNHFCAVVRK